MADLIDFIFVRSLFLGLRHFKNIKISNVEILGYTPID